MRRYPYLALSAAIAVAGCGNPKAASKDHFAKALTAFFNRKCVMLSLDSRMSTHTTVPATVAENTSAALGNNGYEVLCRCRSPEANEGEPCELPGLAKSDVRPDRKGPLSRQAAGAMGPGSPDGFCAGYMRIVSVDQFTNPVVKGGQRVSQVTFTARPDVDKWAPQPGGVAAFPNELQHA
ncbi:MAG: hypothetical protein ABI369_04905 [Acetobacteraceae bacterium]